jgi:exopolyphosphatase/guanosine-5'-triphosphate,3'-diphosphate pyrophosphatase
MTMPLRISAADLGTNTLKVTHAVRLPNGELADLVHASETVRLGFGIEQTGKIEQKRFDDCITFLKEQEAVARQYGSTVFIGVATEALRIAANGEALLRRIHEETSWSIEIISGDREAHLTYLGLKDMVPADTDCAIVDIGGGSTEIVVIRDGDVTLQKSVPVGSGRLADRYFADDPPGMEAEQSAIKAAREALGAWTARQQQVPFIMLAGGSGLFMNQLIEQLFGEVPFTTDTLARLADHLATIHSSDTIDRINIPQARALVLPASVAVGVAIMQNFDTELAQGVPSGIRRGLIRQYGG